MSDNTDDSRQRRSIGPLDLFSDRILIRPVLLGESIVDDDNIHGIFRIEIREQPSALQGYMERRKQSRRHPSHISVRPRVAFPFFATDNLKRSRGCSDKG